MTLVIEQPVRRQTDRIFFTGMAVVSAEAGVLGFAPTYFVRNATLPPLTLLYQLHGALFTAWIALFIVQTSLVASGRPDIHRKLGIAGALLAAAVFVMGVV